MSDHIVVLSVGSDCGPLEETADDISVQVVDSVDRAVSAVEDEAGVDCLVVDSNSVTEDSTTAVCRVHNERPDVPVFLTDVTGEAVSDALAAGATDVVDRSRDAWPSILANRVRHAVERSRLSGAHPDSRADSDDFPSNDRTLNALLEWSSDRLSILDETGTYTFVSPAVEHLMGHAPSELLGASGFEYVHPDDREAVQTVFERIVDNPDEIHSVEYRLRDADGNWRWVESRGTNRLDDSDIQGIVVNSREITERREREQQLRSERRRFETLFEQLTQPVVEVEFVDGDPIVRQTNPAFEETFGYESEEITGNSLDTYLVDESDEATADELNEQMREGVQLDAKEVTRETADGQREFLLQTALYDDQAQGFAVYTDITEQKQRQQQLREEKALSDTILNTLPDIFFWLDEHGEFVRWNDRANEVSGFSDEEIVSMHPSELVVEADRQKVFDGIATVIEDDETAEFEARALRKHGDPIPYEYTGTKLTDETGAMLGIVGLGRDISARKERQRELERKNHLFEQTQQMAEIGAWELDVDTGEMWLTDEMKRIYGLSPTRSLGVETALDYFVPEDEPLIREAVENAIENGESYDLEARLVDADGNERWVNAQGEPQFEDGEVVTLRGTLQDITDQKTREERIREEEALTRTIFDTLPDVLYAFDEQINFLRWNDRLAAVTGYSDDEIADMHPAEFVAPEDREQIFAGISQVVEDDKPVTVEARFETKAGERIPYEFTGAQMTDETGAMLGLVGIGRDISDRKKRQRRFEAVFNNTYQFTGLMAPDGTLLEANDTALQFGGLDRDDVVGEPLWDVYWFQNNDRAREVARDAVEQARDGSLYREEIEVQGTEGTEIIDFSVRPITDDQGEVRLLIPEGRTITDLKERERHLQVLNRFLRHNLRNKMTVIKGTAATLCHSLDDSEHLEHIEQINDTAGDLVELGETAHEFLQMTVEAEPAVGPTDIEAVLSRVVSESRTEYPAASLSLSVDTTATVTADYRLEAVFEQLIENAIVHADHDDPAVSITVTETAENVLVRVADNGPGIPADELSGIVTDENQTQLTHGTGFGLWLVRSIVDEYNGDLNYEDTPDGGVMVVSLQFADGHATERWSTGSRAQ